MRQIRNNVFETNSSSTHSIAIPDHSICTNYPKCISFRVDEFGWGFEEVDPADYLYTAIYSYYCGNKDTITEKLNKIAEVLDNANIAYDMREPKEHDYYYVDHSEDLGEFLDAVFETDNALLDFICFGKVFTGNDNADDAERCFLYPDEETYDDEHYDSETKKWITNKVKNPYYRKDLAENYTWYYKGN